MRTGRLIKVANACIAIKIICWKIASVSKHISVEMFSLRCIFIVNCDGAGYFSVLVNSDAT